MYEMYSYFVIKPSSLHRTETVLTYDIFPKILFCPEPAFDLDQLTLMNYNGAFQFFFGNFYDAGTCDIYKEKILGWSGAHNKTQYQVKQELYPKTHNQWFC